MAPKVIELSLPASSTYNSCIASQCCKNGEGFFKLYLEEGDGSWNEIISGGSFFVKEVSYVINLQPQTMTKRDQDWLDSHNTRRKEWHERYGKTYVPLKWSNGLKESSNVWALELLER